MTQQLSTTSYSGINFDLKKRRNTYNDFSTVKHASTTRARRTASTMRSPDGQDIKT
jgi:hypothetical protein